MRTMLLRVSLLAVALAWPGTALADVTAGQPFPSNLYTTADATQVTISPTADIAGGFIGGVAVPGTPKGVPATYSLAKGQSV